MGGTATRHSRASSSASPAADKVSGDVSDDKGPKKSAYLVTSPGFAGEFAANLAIMGCVAALCIHIQPLYEVGEAVHGFVLEQMMHGAQRMAWWSLLGLLSSSCCALQIMLNAFSFGCAGFNTTLGPWRPTFLALTVAVQTISWCVAYGRPYQWAPTAASTALSAVLTMLPEVLALWTARRERLAAVSGSSTGQKNIQLQLSSLGCSACVAKVSSVLGAMPQVCTHRVCLEDGVATVQILDDCNVTEVMERIEAAGFPAKLIASTVAATQDADTTESSSTKNSDVDVPELAWAQRNATAVCAGLLSSSCCLLQLTLNALAMLNVIHVGCAGFNKILGPWRTEMRTVTVGWLGVMWALSLRHSWPKLPLVGSTLLAVGLAWLPELLLMLGTGGGFSGIAPPTTGSQRVQLDIGGMGCEACQVHVRTVIDMSAGVLGSAVDWKAGKAELWVNPEWGFNLTRISAQLELDGYTTVGAEMLP